MAEILERGDVYFFYRPKVDVEEARELDQVQRFYLVLAPDDGERARLFVIGKKRMPEIVEGESRSTEREWMLNSSTDAPERIGDELGAIAYQTKTRGERQQPAAIPAAAGRYALFSKDDSTRLGYRVTDPDELGAAQDMLGIAESATYLVAVRNPSIDVPGFPDAKPDYPKYLSEKFGDERWIDIFDARLLDYESAQLVLIGARQELDSSLDITGKPKLFSTLGIDSEAWPTEPLESGEAGAVDREVGLSKAEGDRSRGGERGGKAALEAPSAAGIARALSGIEFPRNRKELVKYAKEHDASPAIVEVLEDIPGRKFETMADVEKAVAEVR